MHNVNSPAETIISVRDLSKRFGQQFAVHDLSLTLLKGEILGLVGANGGGKTTTLRMLAGLLKPDSGTGTVLGCNLFHDNQQIRQRIGYLSQGFSLYPTLTVWENLRFRADVFSIEHPKPVCNDIISKFHLEPYRHTRAEQLSGGWKTLLQVAAVTVHHPELILMDEPTTGLDVSHRQIVWQHFTDLASTGIGLVISTHDLNEAHRCSQVALLAAGTLQAMGSVQSIIDRSESRVLQISGNDLSLLRDQVLQYDGVRSCYMQGTILRVILEPRAIEVISQLASSRTCTASLSNMTLEDAALAIAAAHTDKAA